MVKCPKCGIRGDYYTTIATIDRDIDGNKMIETNIVECDECKHWFTVEEVYKITLEYFYNVE